MKLACVLALLVGGCGASSADLGSLRDGLSTAGALGVTAQLALASVTASTDVAVCAATTTRCSTYPCMGAATVTLGSSCPLPLGDGATGSVTVTGMFTSADMATISSTFVGVRSTVLPIVVVQAQTVGVARAGDVTTVTYTNQDVDTTSTTSVEQASWTVKIDDRGTADPSDDVTTVDGVVQDASFGADDLTVTSAELTPACRKNPVAGTAMVERVNIGSITQDSVAFHAACDGAADVTGATGGEKSIAL